jgi:excisionase family DNA binding protein
MIKHPINENKGTYYMEPTNKYNPEEELTPAEVAKYLNIAYKKARRLMETNEIRSWVDTRAINGRKFLKTVHREVIAYHERKIESRAKEMEQPARKPIRKKTKDKRPGLSSKSIEEFFRTEIFNA